MSLVKFNSQLPLIDRMLSSIWDADNLFHDDFMVRDRMIPAVNVKELKDTIEIEVAAPGLTKKDFKVQLENDLLTISTEKTSKKEEENDVYSRKEFNYSTSKRSIVLPNTIDMDKKMIAHYDQGILKISLNKKEEYKVLPKTKVIEID